MSAKSKVTVTDWVDEDDAPELTGAELDHPEGQWLQGGKALSADQGRAAFREQLSKKQVNMLLDADVLGYFKQKAGGRGYQTLINRTLRESMERESLLDAVRQAVREEMRHHE
ncbi:BrnA antitoxin family protein [Acidithiobacillus sp. MC6.1]|nr:BrnA antitoxin family protein [Acidithiobacillus sp. MC6.1]